MGHHYYIAETKETSMPCILKSTRFLLRLEWNSTFCKRYLVIIWDIMYTANLGKIIEKKKKNNKLHPYLKKQLYGTDLVFCQWNLEFQTTGQTYKNRGKVIN